MAGGQPGVAGDVACPDDWVEVGAVLQQVRDAVLPRLFAGLRPG
ncbi:MAG: hypothetical protein R3D29_16680 [Nitratireductor sp.]